MRSVRAMILRKLSRQLELSKTPKEQELAKGKIYKFLERCRKQDLRKAKR